MSNAHVGVNDKARKVVQMYAGIPKDATVTDREHTGNIVTFESVSAHAPGVVSYIEPVQGGSGDPAPNNIRPISGHDAAVLYVGGKNMLDAQKAKASDDTPDALNGATVENGMIDVIHQATSNKLIIPVKIKKGVWLSIWCKAEVYDRPDGYTGWIMVNVETDTPGATTSSMLFTDNGESASSKDLFVAADSDSDIVNVILTINKSNSVPANVRLWPMVVERISVPSGEVEFEPYRGREYVAGFGETIYGGAYNWNTGSLAHDWVCRVLDGAENWQLYNYTNNPYFYLDIGARYTYVADKVICSHYAQAVINSGNTLNGVNVVNSTTGYDRLIFRPDMSAYNTLDKWKAYLAGQAGNGTPVTVAHQRTDATVTQTAAHAISVIPGANTLYSTTGDTKVTTYKDNPEGVARRIRMGYVGVNGKARRFYATDRFVFDGDYTVSQVEIDGVAHDLYTLTSSGALTLGVGAKYWLCGGGGGGFTGGGGGGYTASGALTYGEYVIAIGAGGAGRETFTGGQSASAYDGTATSITYEGNVITAEGGGKGTQYSGGDGGSGGGTAAGWYQNAHEVGKGAGVSTYPFGLTDLCAHSAGGGAGATYTDGRYLSYEDGHGGSDGGDGTRAVQATSSSTGGGKGGAYGGGNGGKYYTSTGEGESGSAATFYGGGGGGGGVYVYNDDSTDANTHYGAGGAGCQGVVYIAIPR